MGRAGMIGGGGGLLLLVLSLLFGTDLTGLGGGGGAPGAAVEQGGEVAVDETPEEARMVEFVSFVLDTAQATWQRQLPAATGVQYRPARLVLFRDVVNSGCGTAQSAMGPFYCPLDERVYIDLGFFDELHSRFGAPGDFAQAYVLAHEIGHHVQHQLGTDAEVRRAQQANPARANELSVALELQADCYAGIWGHSTARRDLLQEGDIEEGLAAAAAVGDDRIQRRTSGTIDVESFTHGSSEQRASWFMRGFRSGDPASCDTFGAFR